MGRTKSKNKKFLKPKPRPYHGEVKDLYASGYSSSSKKLIITVKFNAAIKDSQFWKDSTDLIATENYKTHTHTHYIK
jgi:hypothetical protein